MLLYLLLNDEITDLFAYKLQMLNSDKKLEMPRTKIDTVARLWQDIFPKNEILRGNGQIKFRNMKQADRSNRGSCRTAKRQCSTMSVRPFMHRNTA